MKASLSVITPVFNGIRFIEFCINNVIEQKCSNVEHIIVDGGSTDGTVDIIKDYAERHEHIRWVSEKDKGQSDAMNKGIAMANGNILSFLNVDDFYELGALNYAIEKFETLPVPSFLVGNCNILGDDETVLSVNKPTRLKLTQLLVNNGRYPFPVNPSAYFYHASLHEKIGGYSTAEYFAMDIDFVLRALTSANNIYVNKTLGNYRYIAGTKTFESEQSSSDFLKLIDSYLNTLPVYQKIFVLFMRMFKNWRLF